MHPDKKSGYLHCSASIYLSYWRIDWYFTMGPAAAISNDIVGQTSTVSYAPWDHITISHFQLYSSTLPRRTWTAVESPVHHLGIICTCCAFKYAAAYMPKEAESWTTSLWEFSTYCIFSAQQVSFQFPGVGSRRSWQHPALRQARNSDQYR